MSEETKHSILIVDDDAFLLEMYSIKFKEKGFDVHTATSSGDALTLLKDGLKPDVITIDVVMPTMDGLELLNEIKSKKLAPQALVTMLTNQSHPENIDKANEYGADGYITKASTIPSEVYDQIMELLKKKST